jgi:hypothetical protein
MIVTRVSILIGSPNCPACKKRTGACDAEGATCNNAQGCVFRNLCGHRMQSSGVCNL